MSKPRKPTRLKDGVNYAIVHDAKPAHNLIAGVDVGFIDIVEAEDCRKLAAWLLKAADYLDAHKGSK